MPTKMKIADTTLRNHNSNTFRPLYNFPTPDKVNAIK